MNGEVVELGEEVNAVLIFLFFFFRSAHCMEKFGVDPRDDWIRVSYGNMPVALNTASNIVFSNGLLGTDSFKEERRYLFGLSLLFFFNCQTPGPAAALCRIFLTRCRRFSSPMARTMWICFSATRRTRRTLLLPASSIWPTSESGWA